jgi:hypothetical protein
MKFNIKIWFVYISNSTNLFGCVVVNFANLLEHEVNKLFHMLITLIFLHSSMGFVYDPIGFGL